MRTLARPHDKAKILRRLRTVQPDSLARWGRMSAHQMVCHLSDGLRIATGQKPVSHDTGPLLRTLVKWTVLYAPIPWPAGILTRPEIDQELGGTTPVDFTTDIAQLEALVQLVTMRTTRVDWQVHPIFGRMSEAAWLRWAYLHIDHHLRQFGA
ncbi:MAG: DUF1569 domain-containing protein [Longimicrobiales bacterium]